MIVVFHHCGLSIISNMEFLHSWVTNLYICIAQLENIPIKSMVEHFLEQLSALKVIICFIFGHKFVQEMPDCQL